MKTKLPLLCFCLLASAFCLRALAQGTAFTYQGRLSTGTGPANGLYDFQFQVFDAATLGNSYGSPNPNSATAVAVSNGLFTVALDFGAVFDGNGRWLEIAVRTNSGGAFTSLVPRQPLTPTPYALYAPSAGTAATSSSLVGTLPDAQLSGNVALRAGGNTFTGNQDVSSGNLTLGSGKLGIGTTTPQTALDVIGDGRMLSLDLKSPNSHLAFNAWLDTSTNNWRRIMGGPASALQHNYGDAGGFSWLVAGSGVAGEIANWTLAMSVATNGHVGIGLSSPESSLQVNGGIRARGGPPGAFGGNDSGYAFGPPGDNDSGMFSSADGQLEFYLNAQEMMRLTNGNVGIGTTTPQARLDVNGPALVSGAVVADSQNSNAGGLIPGLLFGLGSGEGIASQRLPGANQYGLDFYTDWQPRLSIANNGVVIIDPGNTNAGGLGPGLIFGGGSGEGIASRRQPGANQYGLDFYTDWQPRLSVTANGNVGIGTPAPAEQLEVAGAVVLGSTANSSPKAGTMRWTGTDFEGYTGTNWVSLTGRGIGTVTPIANMVWIPPGTFVMDGPDEGPQTTVTLTRGFYMGKYEVTQGEYYDLMHEPYYDVMYDDPSWFNTAHGYGYDPSRPVEQVSWNDAVFYCAVLTIQERQAGRIPPHYEYRLPTEAEWEYACRAGTTTRFSYGDDPGYTMLANYAWYSGNSGSTTHPVGQKLANPWGLYDMYGNVTEWCQDWFDPYPGGSVTDPQGPQLPLLPPPTRVSRGGSWYDAATSCRSASRAGAPPELRYSMIGFRVLLAPAP